MLHERNCRGAQRKNVVPVLLIVHRVSFEKDVVKDSSCAVVEGVRKNIMLMDCLKLFAQTETLSKDDAW